MERRKLYIIFIAAFMTKLLLILFFKAETFEYETIASNILSGKGFVYGSHRAFVQPFYPLLTAAINNQCAMRVLQCVVSSALCFLVYSIARRFTGVKQSLLASALVAFHPGLAVYSVLKLHPLAFDAFLYLLVIDLALRVHDRKSAVFSGASIGLALLARPTILLFSVLSLRKYALLIILSACVVYAPWVIRNYRVFGEFIPSQTCSYENLWAGNNEYASGSAILPSGKSVHTKMPQEMREDLKNLDELGQARYYRRHFFNFVRMRPFTFAALFIKKFYYFWWFSPQTGVLYSPLWTWVYKVYYSIIFFFFILGVKKKLVPVLILYMLSIAFLHAVVNVDIRHRWTVEPIMIIFASIGFFG